MTLDLPSLWPRLLAAGVQPHGGMSSVHDGRRWLYDGGQWIRVVGPAGNRPPRERLIPDTSDGPTRGGLLDELRRLSGDPLAYTNPHEPDGWDVNWGSGEGLVADTEGDALILALAVVCGVEVTGG